jgi:hypothetical protein
MTDTTTAAILANDSLTTGLVASVTAETLADLQAEHAQRCIRNLHKLLQAELITGARNKIGEVSTSLRFDPEWAMCWGVVRYGVMEQLSKQGFHVRFDQFVSGPWSEPHKQFLNFWHGHFHIGPGRFDLGQMSTWAQLAHAWDGPHDIINPGGEWVVKGIKRYAHTVYE